MTRAALIASVAARSGFPTEQIAALAGSLWQPDGLQDRFTAQHVAALMAQVGRWRRFTADESRPVRLGLPTWPERQLGHR